MPNKRKVILLLIARFEFGGIPIQAFLWANFLKKNNYHPIILAQYTHDPKYLELLKQNSLEYDFLNTSNLNGSKRASIKYFLDLINHINSFKPDFIFPFNKHLSYHVNLIWRITSAKRCYFMERNHGIEKSISVADSLMKYLSEFNSSGLIFNSLTASQTSRFPKKTFVIKNAYRSIVKTQNLNFHQLAIQPSDCVLLHVANIVPQKNYALLLEAWELLRASEKNFKLIVIGSDIKNVNQALIQSFSELGIIYLGKNDNIFPFVQRADFCLLSTHHEGCPNVILEYMDAGKLIVASDIPSIREVLDPANHEYLFDNKSSEDFVDKVLSLYHLSEIKKAQLIEMNRTKLESDYTESNYNQILNLLND